jgi:hypothetical protein
MLMQNGCVETLDEQEAVAHGNYIVVEEEVSEEKIVIIDSE